MNSGVDPDILIDEHGICSHCKRYLSLESTRIVKGEKGKIELSKLVKRIKSQRRRSRYDCIIGVSGGLDSTYVLYLACKLGLKPLAVHFDNGWNSELATKNIEQAVKILNVDLITYVVNWNEFKDLQLSFFKSSTPDCEIPTDHGIMATLWKEADKRNISFILSGMNFATESIDVRTWSYGHSDWKYIKNIHKRFGKLKLKTYPYFTPLYLAYLTIIRGIRNISILNYVDYDKQKSLNTIKKELGWRYYGGKHYESIFTRFFQGYYLPKKFNIDKRYGHYSDLIFSGQISRQDALKSLEISDYPIELQNEDLMYICKKLNIELSYFNYLMDLPLKNYSNYPNGYQTTKFMKSVVNFLRKRSIYPR